MYRNERIKGLYPIQIDISFPQLIYHSNELSIIGISNLNDDLELNISNIGWKTEILNILLEGINSSTSYEITLNGQSDIESNSPIELNSIGHFMIIEILPTFSVNQFLTKEIFLATTISGDINFVLSW